MWVQNAEVSARLSEWKQIPSGEPVMADSNRSVCASVDDRETRIRQLLERLQPVLEQRARQMAEALTDTPPEHILGAVEYTLRDLGHELASRAHQAGLDAGKKRGT